MWNSLAIHLFLLFFLSMDLLLNEIIQGGIFGRIVGYICVVEYQAKLLPNIF